MSIESEHIKIQKLIVNSNLEKRLLKVLRLTFSENISLDYFRAMFKNCNYLDITFLSQNNVDVGFMYFTTFEISRKIHIIRPAVGIIQKHRIKGLKPFKMSLAKSIFMYQLRNPTKQVYIVSINVNPLMYSGLCAYWSQTYPSPELSISDKYASAIEAINQYFDFKMNSQYIVKLPFSCLIDKKDTQRMNRNNKFIRFFFVQMFGSDAEPTLSDMHWDKGLLSLTPVSLKNLINILLRQWKIKRK
ncbi:hypothetical protein [Marinomonas transparens]|uniref:Uncharacterized protein n=1 Tax=Marinomonas transparens TaxID=2795388 RepID=A0A934N1K7_9GAMM|nr:hypothetical protein [Marinomonas transparens]MBJ7539605.1 hypothetical protein [Marinomonas transparens]